jgi:hypothetical protein
VPKVNIFLPFCALLVCAFLVHVSADQEKTIAAQRAELLKLNDFSNSQMVIIEDQLEQLKEPCETRTLQEKDLRGQLFAKLER